MWGRELRRVVFRFGWGAGWGGSVSIETLSNWRPGSPDTICPPIARAPHESISAMSSKPESRIPNHRSLLVHARAALRQRFARDGHVVERQHAIADHLVLLVSLAGDEQQITRPGETDGFLDRLAAIRNRQQPHLAATGVGGDAAQRFLADAVRGFAARVVRR